MIYSGLKFIAIGKTVSFMRVVYPLKNPSKTFVWEDQRVKMYIR